MCTRPSPTPDLFSSRGRTRPPSAAGPVTTMSAANRRTARSSGHRRCGLRRGAGSCVRNLLALRGPNLLLQLLLQGGLLLGGTPLFAQSAGTGTIAGRVFDQSGSVVPGAALAARNVATGAVRQTVTTPEGAYTLSALPVGEYEVTTSHPGFSQSINSGVVVSADSTAALNITLQFGQPADTVEVVASPAQLDTQTSDISQIVSGKQVLDVPLNGRNFTQLLTLGTGVVTTQTGRRMGLGQEGNPLMSINGG